MTDSSLPDPAEEAFERALAAAVAAAFAEVRARTPALRAEILRRIREETARAAKETPWTSFARPST